MAIQEPDTQPGNYYVSVRIGDGRSSLMLGPFVNDHAGALAMVDQVRTVAVMQDWRANFYAFGTVRMDPTYRKPGVLNAMLGLPTDGGGL